MSARTWVPGPGGYALGVVLGWFVFSATYVTLDVPGSGPVALVFLPVAVLFCATYGLPVTIATTAVVVLLRGWGSPVVVHALLAGAAGALLAAGWLAWTYPAELEPVDGPWSGRHVLLALLVGLSAALARAVAHRWLPRR